MTLSRPLEPGARSHCENRSRSLSPSHHLLISRPPLTESKSLKSSLCLFLLCVCSRSEDDFQPLREQD